MSSGMNLTEVFAMEEKIEAGKVGDRLYTFESLQAAQFPAHKWVVKNLIPRNGITVLSSMPGTYKTWILLHMAMCISTGESVFGKFETGKPIKVLMIDEENGPSLIQDRTKSLKIKGYPKVTFMFDGNIKATENEVDKIIEFCGRNGIKMVTIDSLVRIHYANENDASEMSRVFNVLKKFPRAGITLLLTHHNRKPGIGSTSSSHEMRGSSDILASLDCHISLTRNKKVLTLKQTKIRHREELKPFNIEVINDSGKLDLLYKGEINTQDKDAEIEKTIKTLLERDGSMNQSTIAEEVRKTIPVGINRVRDALQNMVRNEVITPGEGERRAIQYELKA